MSKAMIHIVCLWCSSPSVVPYGQRYLCRACGQTWHRDSKFFEDELERRKGEQNEAH